MEIKKIVALALAVSSCVSMLGACGKKTEEQDGKINISISNWPDETNPNGQETHNKYLAEMNAKYPDVNVIPDYTVYADAKTFQMKAAADQLPTMYKTGFTEVKQIIQQGYAKDITKIMEERGLTDSLNPELLDFSRGEDGKLYSFPLGAYLMSLTINKDLFKQAGLVNADGSVKIPSTYQEVAEYAKIIKEKTGVAGFALATTNNCGGWHFMNIAWSFGVDFMEQREDGTWEATFNTQEARDALQYVKDLRWKYDVLPVDTAIKQADLHKLYGVNQAAMILECTTNDYTQKYGMDPKNIVMAKMPAGPAGRCVQMGGSVWMFSPSATDEEVNACFDWLEITGVKAELDEAGFEKLKESHRATIEQNGIVLEGKGAPLARWADPERVEAEIAARAEVANVPLENCETYYDISDVIIKAEEPRACQQLYAVLDGCIQEVIVNENADVAKLIEIACNDFQVNHLDKIDY